MSTRTGLGTLTYEELIQAGIANGFTAAETEAIARLADIPSAFDDLMVVLKAVGDITFGRRNA